MKYLVAQLTKDLNLVKTAVREISGDMSDAEQQGIVEESGAINPPCACRSPRTLRLRA